MLRKLSGKTHSVFSAFTIIDGTTGRRITKSDETLVTFRTLTDQEINDYIKTGDPMDKAGAYGIQSGAGKFVDHYEGDYLTVAIVPYKDFKDCAEHVRNWVNIIDGLNSWFGGPDSIDNYFERVERGETNPLQEWESIKVRFGLSDKFDVRERNVLL